jgi:hypothetical protein
LRPGTEDPYPLIDLTSQRDLLRRTSENSPSTHSGEYPINVLATLGRCPQSTRSDLRPRSFQPGHALLRNPEDGRPHEGGIGARMDVSLCFEVAHRSEEGVGISNDPHFFGHRSREHVYVGGACGLLRASASRLRGTTVYKRDMEC